MPQGRMKQHSERSEQCYLEQGIILKQETVLENHLDQEVIKKAYFLCF